MSTLFHQNMRNFGGGTAPRNGAYAAAFAGIVPALPQAYRPIEVGGFTEVLNNKSAATEFGPGAGAADLCGQLGLIHLCNVACGTTALAQGNPEYIALGTRSKNTVVTVGRMFLHAEGSGISLIHDRSPALPPPPGWLNHVPEAATRDYRGLVYAIVDIPIGGGVPARIAVGFIHNLYTFKSQRSLVMGNIPHMLRLMGDAIPKGLAAIGGIQARYIGGDFNVKAKDPTRGTKRTGKTYAYFTGLTAANAPVIPALPLGYKPFKPGGTTWAGNLYDYWFSSVPPGPLPVPWVTSTTLNAPPKFAGTMSDHAASGLRI